MVTVPDRIDPVIGWRTWAIGRVRDGLHEGWLLASPITRTPWAPRVPIHAQCRKCSEVPRRTCGCGIYAFTTGPFSEDLPSVACRGRSTFEMTFVFGRRCVVGQVAGWGRVVRHVKGWRAEFAYPQSLAIVCGPCLFTRRHFNRATRVDSLVSGHGAVCEGHAHEEGFQREARYAAEDVEAALLACYRVPRATLPTVALPAGA